MKRIGLLIFAVTLIMAGQALAAEAVGFSTRTADATIHSGRAYFYGITVQPDGTNDVTVAIYDNTAASGTKVAPTFSFAGTGGAKTYNPTKPKLCSTGIYVDVTVSGGGSVEYTVDYEGK